MLCCHMYCKWSFDIRWDSLQLNLQSLDLWILQSATSLWRMVMFMDLKSTLSLAEEEESKEASESKIILKF